MQARSPANIKGIDVSHHQGAIDWKKVAADGVKFAFIKATQGTSFVSPTLVTNAKAAAANGIKVSYYHFAEPDQSPTAQVDHFLKTIQGLPIDLALILDIEGDNDWTPATANAFSVSFMAYLQQKTGKVPMLYTGAYFAKSKLTNKELGKYNLWVAHYGTNDPMDNPTWSRWAVFQYTSSGKVAGIAGNVDMNEMDQSFWIEMTNPQKVEKPVDKPADKPTEIPEWKRTDHDELLAAGLLTSDHTASLDEPVPQWMLFVLLNRLRKGEAVPQVPQPSPVPTPDPKPEPEPVPTPQPPSLLEWVEVERRTALASVQITFGTAGRGSGTLLPGGYVLTAKHVGNGIDTITVRTKANGTLRASLVGVHPGYKGADGKLVNVDVALYRVTDSKLQNSLPSLPISGKGVTAGQELLAVVHGDAIGKVKRGVVDRVSISTSSPPTPWEFDCSIDGNPGDSGGAAVNQYGELIGVIIQETQVNAKIGSAWQRVPGCEAVNITHPVVANWLKQYL
ncbi:GH25 family lysozyme [Brevibacillus centrosporus]|uniref:GH25 family lysozyme n=1 Tax=Brevibacillus centrosporus TaxID=54910 RepID=UPI000F0A3190|nr:GH25 family lysozyme [Brevibacillus centrosporus]MEC2128117.1 GH25 family lysozyme [Brevibacillus centrosporus]RNB63826.1 hypothetical protein EDM55_28375 [Brevibacillus centrosporus]GED35046.1 hypothetical protein BCE02nite_61870 [Brevibacillus centrosporus]